MLRVLGTTVVAYTCLHFPVDLDASKVMVLGIPITWSLLGLHMTGFYFRIHALGAKWRDYKHNVSPNMCVCVCLGSSLQAYHLSVSVPTRYCTIY